VCARCGVGGECARAEGLCKGAGEGGRRGSGPVGGLLWGVTRLPYSAAGPQGNGWCAGELCPFPVEGIGGCAEICGGKFA